VPGRHVDDQALVFSRCNVLELLRDHVVVGTGYEFRPHFPHVLQKVIMAPVRIRHLR
jgi:hypothetical protein